MCDKCANIDYPIGDSIWLPCGGSSGRYRATPRKRSYGEEDFEALRIIEELRETNKRLMRLISQQREELAQLRSIPQLNKSAARMANGWDGPDAP